MNQNAKRFGVMGGTFNPVHNGHMRVAADATQRLGLDHVRFIPTGAPPHKCAEHLADAEHRLEMVRLAIAGHPGFEADDREIRRQGMTYSIDTLTTLQQEHPGSEIWFIIGTDTLLTLHTWKQAEKVLSACRFVTYLRPGTPPVQPDDLRLPAPWPERLLETVYTGPGVDVSSSAVRGRIAEGKPIRMLVPESVEAYIRRHHLYEPKHP